MSDIDNIYGLHTVYSKINCKKELSLFDMIIIESSYKELEKLRKRVAFLENQVNQMMLDSKKVKHND